MPKRASRRPYQRTEFRQADTVEAVVRLCGERNPATLTTAEIADAVKLSQGALFKHFPNKSSLWDAVARWLANQLAQKVAATATLHASPLAGLEAMFLAHVDFVTRHPGAPRLILGELQKPEHNTAKTIVRDALTAYRQRVATLLEAGIAAGEVAAQLDVDAAAVLYLGAIQGLVVQALISNDIASAAHAAPRVFALFRQSIEEPRIDPVS